MLTWASLASSQESYTRSDIFSSNEITWMGLDFSNIKLVGSEGFTDPYTIKNTHFRNINNLILNEPDKYDLKEFFSKQSVDVDLSVIRERNTLPDDEELVLEDGSVYFLDEPAVQEMISQYTPEASEGIAVVLIMESFNKKDERGYMWVTFFDIATKEVLLTDRMEGKAGGFGWRNYWAKTVYNVLKEIGKKQYDRWRKG
jgi:hypothetical protein